MTIYNNTDNSGFLIFHAYTTVAMPAAQLPENRNPKIWK